MPVSTQLLREGKGVPLYWDDWHLTALWKAMAADQGKSEEDTRVFPEGGEYTFTKRHLYYISEVGEDGEERAITYSFEILPGDVYRAWR